MRRNVHPLQEERKWKQSDLLLQGLPELSILEAMESRWGEGLAFIPHHPPSSFVSGQGLIFIKGTVSNINKC